MMSLLVGQCHSIETTISVPNHASFVAFQPTVCDRRKGVGAKKLRQIKIDALELQAKFAVLENEIRLLRDLRSQVNSKLKRQVQSQVRWSRRLSKGLLAQ
jgi:hypothetical protein